MSGVVSRHTDKLIKPETVNAVHTVISFLAVLKGFNAPVYAPVYASALAASQVVMLLYKIQNLQRRRDLSELAIDIVCGQHSEPFMP